MVAEMSRQSARFISYFLNFKIYLSYKNQEYECAKGL